MFTIFHDLTINSSAQKIFEAVSEPKHLDNWWTKESAGEAKLDAEYRLYFSEEFDWLAIVTVCDKNKLFELKMIKADKDWAPTSFGFELLPLEQGVRLSFYHKNWQNTNHHYRRTSYCWAQLLNLLKMYLETGEVVPFALRE